MPQDRIKQIYEVKCNYPTPHRSFYVDKGEALDSARRSAEEYAQREQVTWKVNVWTDDVFTICATKPSLIGPDIVHVYTNVVL